MPFTAPTTIPQICYPPGAPFQVTAPLATPYCSLPRPPAGTILYDHMYNDDLILVKSRLRHLLKRHALSRMPASFPFQWQCRPGRHQEKPMWDNLSWSDYTFEEQICVSDNRSRVVRAIFEYTPFQKSTSRMMEWRVYVPGRLSMQDPRNPAQLCIAHVQVDPVVMEMGFGVDFATKPRIMLEALALSMEVGHSINIKVANSKAPFKYNPYVRDWQCEPGSIIFLGSDAEGRSEVVYTMFDSQ